MNIKILIKEFDFPLVSHFLFKKSGMIALICVCALNGGIQCVCDGFMCSFKNQCSNRLTGPKRLHSGSLQMKAVAQFKCWVVAILQVKIIISC